MSEFDNLNNGLDNGEASANETVSEQPGSTPEAQPATEQPVVQQPVIQEPVQPQPQEPVQSAPQYTQSQNGNQPSGNYSQQSNNYSQSYSQQSNSYGQSSQYNGYRQPHQSYSNEYIYNPDMPKARSSKGGKVAIAVVAAILCIFVIVVVTISAYSTLVMTHTIVSDTKQDVNRIDSGDVTDIAEQDKDVPDSDTDEIHIGDNDTDDVQGVTLTNRNYPTLEQLAAPDDALSIPDIYDKCSPSVVGVSCTLKNATATGTGIIISTDGYIITNAHVIEDAQTVMIVDAESNQYEAEIIGYDSQTDLAVLKIEAQGLTACEFGISSDIRIGELVVAIGNPLGFDLYGTLTTGVISGLNRTLTIGDNEMNLIQTNASINNGNSGGPLIDAYGRVIGITSAKVASIYGEGLGFAIPIDEAMPIIEDLIHYGYVTGRPQIGISGEDITSLMSMYYRLPQGVYVRFINPDSCAEKAGIKAGDIIIGADGETITCMDELNEIKARFSAGDTMVITIYRDGVSMDIELVLDEATASE